MKPSTAALHIPTNHRNMPPSGAPNATRFDFPATAAAAPPGLGAAAPPPPPDPSPALRPKLA